MYRQRKTNQDNLYAMSTEIELKLSLTPDDCAHLLQLPLLDSLSISPAETHKLYTIYYDTPQLDLKHNRIALRLRRINDRWFQSIKGKGRISSGLHRQHEWEAEVNNEKPDYSRITDPDLKRLFDNAKLRQQIRSLFVTEFTRQIRLLQLEDGSKIEFCLDQGKVSANQSSIPLCEIELELKSGKANALFQFALTLQSVLPFPLKLENINKAERGYSLYNKNKAS